MRLTPKRSTCPCAWLVRRHFLRSPIVCASRMAMTAAWLLAYASGGPAQAVVAPLLVHVGPWRSLLRCRARLLFDPLPQFRCTSVHFPAHAAILPPHDSPACCRDLSRRATPADLCRPAAPALGCCTRYGPAWLALPQGSPLCWPHATCMLRPLDGLLDSAAPQLHLSPASAGLRARRCLPALPPAPLAPLRCLCCPPCCRSPTISLAAPACPAMPRWRAAADARASHLLSAPYMQPPATVSTTASVCKNRSRRRDAQERAQ